jgi:hypothetical protein
MEQNLNNFIKTDLFSAFNFKLDDLVKYQKKVHLKLSGCFQIEAEKL